MNSLTADFIPYDNPYMVAAIEKRSQLSALIQKDFVKNSSIIEKIQPIFSSVANGINAKMDKISTKSRAGQLPWPKPGIGNGAYNTIIASLRARARAAAKAYIKLDKNS